MLSDSVADTKMSHITWIIIILIMVSIVVTISEVILRFAMLEKNKNRDSAVGDVTGSAGSVGEVGGAGVGVLSIGAESTGGVRGDVLEDVKRLVEGMGADELRRWRAVLSAEQMEGICGSHGRLEL